MHEVHVGIQMQHDQVLLICHDVHFTTCIRHTFLVNIFQNIYFCKNIFHVNGNIMDDCRSLILN